MENQSRSWNNRLLKEINNKARKTVVFPERNR